jgi:hypothetical protein
MWPGKPSDMRKSVRANGYSEATLIDEFVSPAWAAANAHSCGTPARAAARLAHAKESISEDRRPDLDVIPMHFANPMALPLDPIPYSLFQP